MNFEKVPFEQFAEDAQHLDISEKDLFAYYQQLKLPQRATSGSAGYDFHMPCPLMMKAGERYLIPTGIRCKMPESYVLVVVPRSSLGFKYGLRLMNTLGVIDNDYQFADNHGHIMVRLTLDSNHSLDFNDRFVQGIFLPYGLTTDDKSSKNRTGGIGSSGSQ